MAEQERQKGEKKGKEPSPKVISDLWQQFHKTESVVCPNDKSKLEVSAEIQRDRVTFTLECSTCAWKTAKGFRSRLEKRYVEFCKIGRGSMGEVYLARHFRLGRRVAIKKMFPNLSGEGNFPKRFEREIRLHSSLIHPHITAIYDRNVELATKYIVMEYAEGGNFDGLLSKTEDLARKFSIFLQVCVAVNFAHSKGILHRDIKPQNILIDGEGNAKVSDFGLAALFSRDSEMLTDSSSLIGSFPYMAPEQYTDPRKVDFRADIYSLGVIFYQILTNRLPFIYPPSIRDIDRVAGRTADSLFRRMIAENRRKRIPSIAEVFAGVVDFMKKKQLEIPENLPKSLPRIS